MSWQAQTAVTHHSKLTQIHLLRLLMYLADKADEHGLVDPAPNQDTLAEFFGCSDRTIRTWIGRICEVGELKQIRVGSGPGNPSSYQICLEMLDKGGRKAEENMLIVSTFEKLDRLEARLQQAEDRIMQLEEMLEETGPKRWKQGGNKGGSKVEIKEEARWKPSQRSGADDPSLDPSLDPSPPNPQGGIGGVFNSSDGETVFFFEGESETTEDAEIQRSWEETLSLIALFERLTGKKSDPLQRNGRYKTSFMDYWVTPIVNMQKIGNGHTAVAIERGIKEMDDKKLTVATPRSIEPTVLGILRRGDLEKASSRQTAVPTPSTGEYGGII